MTSRLVQHPDDTAQLAITITDINEPPTVALANTTTTFPENTDTTSAIKVADIVVTDDALGTNTLSLSGADAALFQIVGTELFLVAGATAWILRPTRSSMLPLKSTTSAIPVRAPKIPHRS